LAAAGQPLQQEAPTQRKVFERFDSAGGVVRWSDHKRVMSRRAHYARDQIGQPQSAVEKFG